jgi:cytochrome c oxidase assembly factor CtaG
MGALGAWLAALQHPIYALDAARTAAAGQNPVADQQLAGWLGGMGAAMVMLPALLAVTWQALVREERRARAREAAT